MLDRTKKIIDGNKKTKKKKKTRNEKTEHRFVFGFSLFHRKFRTEERRERMAREKRKVIFIYFGFTESYFLKNKVSLCVF